MRVSVKEVLRAPEQEIKVHFQENLPSLTHVVSQMENVGPAEVDAAIRRVGDRFRVSGWVQSPLRLKCSRCLTPYDSSVRAEFDELFQEDPVSQKEGTEEEAREVEHGWIELEPSVREALLLQLPLAPLCQYNCKGLCPQCGVNRNEAPCLCVEESTDLRWEELKKLLE